MPLGPPVDAQRNSTGEGPAGLLVAGALDEGDAADVAVAGRLGLGIGVGVWAVGVTAVGGPDDTAEPQAASDRATSP
jgi:hypothetical protein